jgi:hypothetical protein
MISAGRIASMAGFLAKTGLILRGGISFEEGEFAPTGPNGAPAKSVLLVGHAGSSIWPDFSAWMDRQERPLADPLDTWSKEVISSVAGETGARAVFPSDRPFLPFQQWATRAEGLMPSPLGILMHPDFGLWHAYRGALLFDVALTDQSVQGPIHLCDICDGKPCTNSCPASAVAAEDFDFRACQSYLSDDPESRCVREGCAARDACPHDAYRYDRDQIRFHMTAYLRGMGARKKFRPYPRNANNAPS